MIAVGNHNDDDDDELVDERQEHVLNKRQVGDVDIIKMIMSFVARILASK